MNRAITVVASLFAGAMLAYGVILFLVDKPERVTTSRLSPSDSLRAYVVEVPQPGIDLDRKFEVRIRQESDLKEKVIYVSPAEGRPVGAERFVWTYDGTVLLLLSKNLKTIEGTELSNGERLYLKYDVRAGQVWCNAAGDDTHPRFFADDLERYDWFEPLPAGQGYVPPATRPATAPATQPAP